MDDNDILEEIEAEFLDCAPMLFFDMLKNSCDATSATFFDNYYGRLMKLPDNTDCITFANTIKTCKRMIQNGNSIGEKKTFVLAQMLQLKYPEQVVVFCSDDSGARQNMIYIDPRFRCLSITSVFQKLRNDGLSRTALVEYFNSLCDFYASHGQKTIKVWKKNKTEKVAITFEELFDGIYSDQFEIKGTGNLRYKEK